MPNEKARVMIKKGIWHLIIWALVTFVGPVHGEDRAREHPKHQGHEGQDHDRDNPGHEDQEGKHDKADNSSRQHKPRNHEHDYDNGRLIHRSFVQGYKIDYHLIDLQDQISDTKPVKGMEHLTATHHLMISIIGEDRNQVEQAKVGFLVRGPNEEKQELMAMSMDGRFCADVNFGLKGLYTIKNKVVLEGRTLRDTVLYEMKK